MGILGLATWPARTLASLAFDLAARSAGPAADRLWAEGVEPPACPLGRWAMTAHDLAVLLFLPPPAFFRADRPNAVHPALLRLEEECA